LKILGTFQIKQPGRAIILNAHSHLSQGSLRYTPSPLQLLTGDITMYRQTLRIAMSTACFYMLRTENTVSTTKYRRKFLSWRRFQTGQQFTIT